MNKIALYRKYRPKTFDQIFGQKIILKILTLSLLKEHLNHAYIFAGPKGSGKTSIAKIFAKAANCLNLDSKGNPCLICKNCLLIENQQTLDILEIDAASNNGVGEIRKLIDSVEYQPINLKFKIYIIDEAHMLTMSAWNALLKTLEEPPENIIFIFATTEYHKIPLTIVSRCQRYDFSKINIKDLEDLIKNVSQKENIKISPSSLKTFVNLSDGAARDCLSLLDQLAKYSENDIHSSDLFDLFSIVITSEKIKFLNLIFENDYENLIKTLNELNEKGVNFYIFLNSLLEILIDKMIFLQTGDQKLLTSISINEIKEINLEDKNKLLRIIKLFDNNLIKMKMTSRPLYLFKFLIIELSNPIIKTKSFIKKEEEIKVKNSDEKELMLKNEEIIIEKSNWIFNCVDISKTVEKYCDQFKNKEDIEQNLLKNDEIIKIKDNDLENKEIVQKKSDNFENNFEFFCQVAANRNNLEKNSSNLKFNSEKELSINSDPILMNLLNAKNFLIISNNGAILLFQTKIAAQKFNKTKQNKLINETIYEIFNRNLNVLGLSLKEAKEFTTKFKDNNKKDYLDVKININNIKEKLLKIIDR